MHAARMPSSNLRVQPSNAIDDDDDGDHCDDDDDDDDRCLVWVRLTHDG